MIFEKRQQGQRASDHWHTPGWRSLALAIGVGCFSPLLSYVASFIYWPWHSHHELSRTAVIAGIATLPLWVFGEECLFRGVILRLLPRPIGAWGAVIVSSALFSLAHFTLAGAISRFASGLLLGWLYVRTRNLWLCMTAHAVHDAVLLTILILAPSMR